MSLSLPVACLDIGTTKVVAVIAEIIYEDNSTINNNVKGVKLMTFYI